MHFTPPRRRSISPLILLLVCVLSASTHASIISNLWSFATQKPLATHLSSSGRENVISHSNPPPGKRVAIIGAGAGGSSSAYYLRKYLESSELLTNETVEITVFERNPYIGGRSTTVNAYDDPSIPVELGASIFVKANWNLANATNDLGLRLRDDGNRDDSKDSDVLGVFNGQEMVFTIPEGSWWSLAKIIYRYGPFAPYKTQKLTQKIVGKFLNMYSGPTFPFASLSDAVAEVGLLEAASQTGDQFLAANGLSGRFAQEMIQASTRVNYNQNLGLIHGVETMVCMATDGAMQIEGGNWRIFAGMLEASSSKVRLQHTATSLERRGGKWHITSAPILAPTQQRTEAFDTVILAAPWQFANLTVSPNPLQQTPDEVPYAGVHVTLFASPVKLDPAFFKLSPTSQVPKYVLTTLNSTEEIDETIKQGRGTAGVGNTEFFSISLVRTVSRPALLGSGTMRREYIYKVFSPAEFSDAQIRSVLGIGEDLWAAVTWIKRKLWYAYPYELPRVTFEEVKLDEGVWYTSGMEGFISTMETMSLMGKNVARLMVEEWEAGKRAEDEERRAEEERSRVREEEEGRLVSEKLPGKGEKEL